jgi:hypothetical protein
VVRIESQATVFFCSKSLKKIIAAVEILCFFLFYYCFALDYLLLSSFFQFNERIFLFIGHIPVKPDADSVFIRRQTVCTLCVNGGLLESDALCDIVGFVCVGGGVGIGG